MAEHVFSEMGCKDIDSWNYMVSWYAGTGDMEKAIATFGPMPVKTSASWAAMVTGYIDSGNLEITPNFYDVMPEQSVVCCIKMIYGYSNNRDVESAREVFDEMGEKDHLQVVLVAYGREKEQCSHLSLLRWNPLSTMNWVTLKPYGENIQLHKHDNKSKETYVQEDASLSTIEALGGSKTNHILPKFESFNFETSDVMEEDLMGMEPGLVFFEDGSYSRGPVDIHVGEVNDSNYFLSPTFKFEQVSSFWWFPFAGYITSLIVYLSCYA
ncbi:putative tetratricopeptide-like helical domain superfamily [Helianthus annuus]|uniref:Putative pentatricopeptide repeat protein n=1 Tax=Helianthus annuus TaxID=4232 RepID=A0A251TWQ9_HELAN|nr:putative tetratricopeptide-like helical domain superfamily [Helianthus annuus]KAJ0550033.1 putative tetratricopeptide-like helical domain superfamily [Helianthus annuus]KAJ0556627.1 putative tetratricopeptide-like helical domain superfamily [Helianthus annuus]KAJ0562991.1 putative tetratricopeptide-like helical domain superfamily [Helianthus annuus]KAJ0728360.1 putative tetratricopeptide-like helical domain superfamily [Helianthus annuus]